MEAFEFVLPLKKRDLLKYCTNQQYFVEKLISNRELPGHLENFRITMRTEGYLTILKQFDVAYSILCSEVESSRVLHEALWQALLKGLTSLVKGLKNLLENIPIPSNKRVQHLNALKMICYLMCQLTDNFEGIETEMNLLQCRKKKSKNTLESIDWCFEKATFLNVLLELVSLDIKKLWEPPVAEESFIDLITSTCYNLIQNPSIAKQKEAREVISNILGVLTKYSNRALSYSLRILQLLQHHEHTIAPLVQITESIVNKYNANNLVFEIMRELGRLDSKDISNDSSGTRSYALFLVDLSAKLPQLVLQNISFLMPFLEIDSSSMRNCILCVIKEILINILSQENLDSSLKKTKEQFFAILKDHLHDVHAFVRSKVLQIWLQIVQGRCLPLTHQEELTNLVLSRLSDKTAIVRRYAIQLLTVLLQMNPFAYKLQYEELNENYEQEKEKLNKMLEENKAIADSNLALIEQNWINHAKAMMEVFEKFPSVSSDEYENLIVVEDDSSMQIKDTIDMIVTYIEQKDYVESRLYLLAGNKLWPDVFVLESSEESDEDEDKEDKNNVSLPAVIKGLKKMFLEVDNEILVGTVSSNEVEVNDLSKQQVFVLYLKDSLTFSAQVKEAVPLICKMLYSKVNSDILEAIEFFVTSYKFGLSSAVIGIRKMQILLCSSKDSAIKDAVVSAFKRIYLTSEMENERSRALRIINNLNNLLENVSLEEFISLEAMIINFRKSGELDNSIIQMMWERFTMKLPNTTLEESRAALNLIMMAAGADSEIIRSNISVLVNEGLGPRAEKDFRIARDTCLAFLKIAAVKKKIGEVAPPPYRLDEDHKLFTRLHDLLLGGLFDLQNEYWVPLCEKAVCTIYTLAESPDHRCELLLKAVAEKIFHLKSDTDSDTNTPPATISSCSIGSLVRIISLVGCIAHRQLEHLNRNILPEMKRRNALLEKNKSKRKKSRKNLDNMTPSSVSMEDELSLTGVTAEDDEAECIQKICETEITTGESLLAAVAPLIIGICKNQSKYNNAELRTAACLALSKLMLISSEFCDNNLQLLFTILEKSSLPNIRVNTIIALGDLSSLFPNLIEPWTAHMYARLRDPSPLVRINTVRVLSHLILNDMVKIKGQISEMAICIIDPDENTQALVKIFFSELSQKVNAIYNILADIISRLSDPEIGVCEESFQIILKFLFNFIRSDKHAENLVEKICQRFRVTSVERQWTDLAFCLSLLTFNEKCVRKLQEYFSCYADKLANDDLCDYMLSILKKSRSRCKAHFHPTIDEIEAKIIHCHSKGLDEDIPENISVFKTPGKAPLKTKKRTSSTNLRTPRQAKAPSVETRVTPRHSQRKKNKTSYFSSDSDED